jgi:formylglycine-generating enzyme required for sulfatase activity
MFTVAEGKENFPVAWVTWYGAKVFALYYGWDLPTEAEWEYACRGGKQYKYGTNDGNIEPSQANYGHNSSNAGARAVGSYYPNPFGLYDMCGNVCEFCHDAWSQYKEGNFVNPVSPEDNRRVCRGGSFDNSIDNCRSSSRSATGINTCWRSSGFRVVHRANNYHY